MASPFSLFRRNQKIMLAFLGVMAMIAFVFLDPLFKAVGRSSAPDDPVKVESKYGRLHQSELDNMVTTRRLVSHFFEILTATLVERQIEAGMFDRRQAQMILGFRMNQVERELLQRVHGAIPEEAAVETLILSKKAEQMGMIISDKAINELIFRLTDGSLQQADLDKAVASLRDGERRMGQAKLFEAIRMEMLASQMSQMLQMSGAGIPPAQWWDYFKRLHQEAKIEFLPVPVSNFVSEVKNPTDAETKAFFDQYKEDLPVVGSPEPGFKRPRKIAFKYLKAERNKLISDIEPTITDAEIKKYYEDNKETQFRAIQLPDKPATPPATEPSTDGAAKDGAADTKPATDKPATDKPATDKPATDKPATDKPADKPADPKPADDKPAEPKPEAPKADAPKADAPKPADEKPATPGEPEKQSSNRRLNGAKMILTSALVQDQDEKKEEKKDDKDPAPATPAPAAAAPVTPAPAAAAPVTPAPAAPATTAAPAADPKAPAATGAPAATAAPATTPPAAAAPDKKDPASDVVKAPEKPKYEPLEKVAPEIRKTLARQKSDEAIDAAFSGYARQLREFDSAMTLYNVRKQSDPDAEAPAEIDLAGYATKEKLVAKTTELISQQQAQSELDISQATVQEPDANSFFGVRTTYFAQLAFRPDQRLFVPVVFPDQLGRNHYPEDKDGNTYLFWKVKEVDEGVPAFDDARPQVVAAWKGIQARKLANSKAEEYAAAARKSGKPLKEALGEKLDAQVKAAGPFTWMTIGNVPTDPQMNRPRETEIDGAPLVGSEFMQTVFGLKPGAIGVAMNSPRDTAYVVQLVDYGKPTTELEQEFAGSDFSRYAAVARGDQESLYLAWLRTIEHEADLRWLSPPSSGP